MMQVARPSWAENLMGWLAASGVSSAALDVADKFIAYGIPVLSFALMSWWTIERALSERERRGAYRRAGMERPPRTDVFVPHRRKTDTTGVDEFDDAPAGTR